MRHSVNTFLSHLFNYFLVVFLYHTGYNAYIDWDWWIPHTGLSTVFVDKYVETIFR